MTGAEQKNKNTPPVGQNQSKPASTFQDIFKEIQKTMEAAQAKQNVPPYASFEEVKKKKEEIKKKASIQSKKQATYKHKELIPAKEKKAAEQYEKFVNEERKKEHDITQKEFKKAYEIKDEEDYTDTPFELDLRNALIGAMVLERPYS